MGPIVASCSGANMWVGLSSATLAASVGSFVVFSQRTGSFVTISPCMMASFVVFSRSSVGRRSLLLILLLLLILILLLFNTFLAL